MNKTSIYVLSVITIIIVACSVLEPAFRVVKFGVAGFKAGYESAENEEASAPDNIEPEDIMIGEPMTISFSPDVSTVVNPQDSIIFDNGDALPLVVDQASVSLPYDKIPAWSHILSLVCTPLQIILLGLLIWRFIKFIINISKSRIFVKKNVTLLRQISFLLLAIAVITITESVANEYLFSSFNFTMEGYQLSAFMPFPWSDLLMALICLLMAQVWALGIEIKEDQELTI